MKVRVQVDGQTYTVEIGDLSSRPIQALVDGEVFAVWPEEVAGVVATAAPFSQTSATASSSKASAPPSNQSELITSPLPGDVVVVAVKPGDPVEAGQLLCTVESMKMNNPIRSTQAGVVESVLIAVGDHVTYGQPILHLRPRSQPTD
jgi:biotin carboxyl carrier protein